MSKSKDKTSNVMTVERLRNHWFGGPQVPFWNYDPKQLTFGIEVEYFIASVSGDSFKLASKSQYLAVISHLIKDFGYHDRKLPDQPGRVSKDTEKGFIAIKPDFAWHILEISLPPRHRMDELRKIMESVFAEVDEALKREGLERLDLSCLPDVPESMDLVDLDRLAAHVELLETHKLHTPHGVSLFPALITATHVHANIFREEDLKLLPALYASESKALTQFSRRNTFKGQTSSDNRSRFYTESLGSQYYLRTIPNNIPHNTAQYVELYNACLHLFPNDKFYPVRDMSYIRPTKYGTLEFRSSCSFKSVSDIMKILEFRRQQIISASESISHPALLTVVTA